MRTWANLVGAGLVLVWSAGCGADSAGKSPASGDAGPGGAAGSSGAGGAGGAVPADGGAAMTTTGGTSGAAGAGAGGRSAAAGGSIGAGGASPAPPSAWANVTGNLAGLTSECGNLTLVSAKPGSNLVIAGVAHGGLYGTTDGGKKWDKLGTGAGSDSIINRPSTLLYDHDHPDTFWESGIYSGPGVFKTTDNGQTWKQLGDITHCDVVSVDFTDPDRKMLLAGGHEQKQKLRLSTNGGQQWTDIGMNLPADSHFSSDPLILDPKTFLLGSCGYGDGKCGVYRSADGGTTWTLASDLPAAAAPLWASDGALYFPLIYDGGLIKSTDQGKTWVKVVDGGKLVTAPPLELPDGRLMAAGQDHVQISSDGGKTFTPLGDKIPFKPSGVTYSVQTNTVYVWHWDCGNVVLSDAIASFGFDYALP